MKKIKVLATAIVALALVALGTSPAHATNPTFAAGPSPALSVTSTLVGYPTAPSDIRRFRVHIQNTSAAWAAVPACAPNTTVCPVSVKVVRGGSEVPITFERISGGSNLTYPLYEFRLGSIINHSSPIATPLEAGDVVTVTFAPGAFTIPSPGGQYSSILWFDWYDASSNSYIWPDNNGLPSTMVDLTPDAPSAPSAVAGDGQAEVTITPNTSGTVPTSYRVTASPGGQYCDVVVPATSCVVTGLTNGNPYTFTVVAINADGTSVASPASGPVTPTGSSSKLAETGNSDVLNLVAGAVAAGLIVLGGVMFYTRRLGRR